MFSIIMIKTNISARKARPCSSAFSAYASEARHSYCENSITDVAFYKISF